MSALTPTPKPNAVITFRLPRAGEKDPHFGLTRSFYHQSEADGRLRLLRLKKRGFARGLTLVPFQAVLNLMRDENPGLFGHLESHESTSAHEI